MSVWKLLSNLEAMPDKRLARSAYRGTRDAEHFDYCVLGAGVPGLADAAIRNQANYSGINGIVTPNQHRDDDLYIPEAANALANIDLTVNEALELQIENDVHTHHLSPEQRYWFMLGYARSMLRRETHASGPV